MRRWGARECGSDLGSAPVEGRGVPLMWTRGQGETVDACGDAVSSCAISTSRAAPRRVKIERAVRASSFHTAWGRVARWVRHRPGARRPRPGRRHGLGLISRQQREDRLRGGSARVPTGRVPRRRASGRSTRAGGACGCSETARFYRRGTRNAPFRLRVTRRMAAESPSRRPGSALPSAHSRPDRDLGTMASNGAGFEEHATARRYWALAWSPTGDGLLVQGELGTERASGGSGIFLGLARRDRTEPAHPRGNRDAGLGLHGRGCVHCAK